MRRTLEDNRIDSAARRRGGSAAAWLILACGLTGGAGAAQTPPQVVLHNRLEPRALGRVLAPATAAPPTSQETPARAPEAIDFASGLGDPICAAASVAWDGQPLPDGEQGTLVPFAFFRSATINEAGRIAFFARVDGADRNQGIFTADADGLRVVALGCGGNGGSGETDGCGDPSPVGGTFSGFFLDTHLVPDINDDGDVLFFADIHEGDAPRGLFLYHAADETIETVAAVGDTLPEGGVIAELGSGNLNDQGRVIFAAKPEGSADVNLYLWDGTAVTTYVAVGDPAPGGGVFTLLIGESFGYPDGTSIPGGPLPGFNDQGQIFFRALVAGGEAERGIFLSQDGEHTWLVRAGDPAPEGGTYLSFEAPLPNDSGEIAFFADIDEGDSSTIGWIAGSPGNWRRAISAFEPIGDGVVTGMAISRNPMSALNDQGDVVLWINRTFPDDSTAGAVIVSRADGERVVIAGQGEPTPEGGTYGSFDAWPAMNDAGQARVGAGTPGLPGQTNTDFVLTLCGAGTPALAFDPSSLAFGDVPVGETSAPQTATLSNTGDADATGVTFSGLPASGFEADTSACGDTLPAGGSCAVSVTFTPAAPGPATATLHVASTEGATANLALSGNGIEDGEPPVIDVDPDSLASTLPEGGTETQPLTIANLGDETLEWEVTQDGVAGARLARSAGRSSGTAAAAPRGRVSRSVVVVNEDGVFRTPEVIRSGDGATALSVPESVAGTAGPAHPLSQGMALWSVDDEDSIAGSVAIDAVNVWAGWDLNGPRLSAYPIAGAGTPAFEFASFDNGWMGVASAAGADRAALMESNIAGTDFRLHAFTSESDGTPDWSFQFPVSDPNLPASFRKLDVSYDGSTIAAVVSDSVTLESTLYVFDAATGEVTLTWTDDLRMEGVDLTDDGSIALVAETNLATVLDTTTGEVLFQTEGSGAGGISYRISGDGSVFIVDGFDFDVYRHDGSTYQQVIHFTQPSSWFGGASTVSRDGSTVGTFAGDFGASWLEGEVYVFDVASGELLGSHPVSGSGQFQGTPSSAASSDDGSVLAFASWGTEFHDWPEVMVFNRDVELIGEMAFPGSAFSVDVSPDGQYVVGGAKAVHANVSGNGGRVELIEVAGGEPADCVLPAWVSVDPTSGTVPAGGEQIADVTFDATGLDPDTYTASLCLASNDPATPLVEIPLTLTVEDGGPGGPVADITPESFGFEVPQGGSDSDTLNVGNAGNADLTWSLAEAEAIVVPQGAPYRYGLAETPAFDAPVGGDRATRAAEAAGLRAGRTFAARSTDGRHGGRPLQAVARVLPARQAAAIGELAEGFDDITQLPGAGWALINNSEPVGPSSWFQGNETIFPSHEGDPNAYVAANFESVDDVGTISNWLITPEVTIVNGTTITFWTRKAELFGEFADRLEVRMSVAGASTDVGDTAESVGDFTEVLLTINPDLIPGEYPQEWTQFTLTVRGRSREPVTGRFAFRYWMTDAGPNGTNGDYIGIDTVSVTQPGEPPPDGCDDPVDIPWLSADPVGGTTAPGASEPVTVAVDTGDLEVGEYTAQLCVTTNDPNAELVTVPVSLTVTGGAPGPVADISPGAFEFEIPAGGSAGDVLDVGNVGTTDLVWSIDEAEDGVAPEVLTSGGRRAASTGTTTPTGLQPAAMPRVPTSALLASRLDPGLVRDAMGHRFRRRLPAPRLTSATPGGAAGGVANWSSLGPPGGDVADVAVSTVDPQIVLAGVVPLPFYSGGTLYRSSDGGVTWTEVPALAGISVYAIEFTPAGDVYIATHDGVWESNDGGLNWVQHIVDISLNPQVLTLAIDPSDPATLWAGVVTHPNQPLSLVRSLDGGETWEDRTPPLTQPLHGEAIAVAPNDSNTVIGTFNGDFDTGEIWVSTDAGATWTNRSAGLPGNPLYDVVYDGSRLLVGGGLWFLDQPVGLYESTDLGVTWTPLHDSTWPLLLVEGIAVDPNDAATILVATYGGGVNRSTDGGATWEIGIGGSGAVLAHSLRFQPGSSEALFVGTSPQGVLRSLDGGDQFSASADGISELDFASIDANPLAPAELAVAYQGQNYGGVLTSVDNGTTWQPEPLPSAGSAVARFAPDGTLYAVATGPSGASQGLYRREADGSWTWLGPDPEGQSASLFQSVRFSVNDPGLILLGGMDVGAAGFEATIWRSGDGGQSWNNVFEATPDSGAWVIDLDIVEDGGDQVMLATFSERFGNQGGVLRSADGGLTWLPSTTGLPAGELGEPELCASAAEPQVFYLSLSPSFLQNQLFRTADGGVSWEPTGWFGQGRTGALACDRVDSQVLYLGLLDVPVENGNHGEVWRSVDGGVTFERFTEGLPGGAAPRTLTLAGTSRLLLASDKGTWATDLAGGGGGCANPADVPWLSVAPASGVTPPGDSVPVDVLVDTAGLDEGEYTARLCVTTNDPAAPLVEIPVHLTVTADSWVQEAKLTTSDGTVGDLFALVVAVDGDTALVGAPLTTVGENVAQGAVYVFVREGASWVEQATLVAADGAAFDTLGFSVALAGDTALVAATGVNASQGAVYVFTREGTAWSEQAKLTAANGMPSDFFGSSVAISGDSAVVGAPNVSLDGTTQQGAAYVFVRDGGNWTEQARIVAADGADGDSYGARVGLSGDTALINASFADVGDNPDQGAAYVYTRNGDTWSEQAKLTAADGVANDNFAITVALDGDTALMGAWTATVEGDEVRGAAYVFTRDGGSWSEQAKLIASDGAAGDSFGVAVALSGDAAVVGAHGADPDGSENEGAAYVFARDGATWSEQAKLVIDDGVGNEGVGGAVALSGDTAVVGAPIASPGAAYVFSHDALLP